MWEPNDIQKKILLELLTSEQLRYSEIKPKNLANDLFNYHLQFLLKKELIIKSDNTYSLSTKGVKFLEETKPISRTEGFTQSYRVSVLYIVMNTINDEKMILVQKRTRKPFLGNTGLPSGKLLKGELIEDAATRLCFKETGLRCKFRKIGVLRSIRHFENDLFSDGFWFICTSVQEPAGDVESISTHGQNYWVSIDEAIKLEQDSATKSNYIMGILESLKNTTTFRFDEKVVEESCKLSSL